MGFDASYLEIQMPCPVHLSTSSFQVFFSFHSSVKTKRVHFGLHGRGEGWSSTPLLHSPLSLIANHWHSEFQHREERLTSFYSLWPSSPDVGDSIILKPMRCLRARLKASSSPLNLNSPKNRKSSFSKSI